LVSLQASGEVVVYDRRSLTPAQAEDWLSHAQSEAERTRPALNSLLTPRWIIAALVMLAAVVVFVRLGFWQLDRLAQRQAHNAAVQAQASQPVLNLNQAALDDLAAMEYRSVSVTGEYDHSAEMVLRNQVWNNTLGVQILTPLKIAGTDQTILVNRGWAPYDLADLPQRAQLNQPGTVTVRGILRSPTERPRYVAAEPTLAPGENMRHTWYTLDLPAMQKQSSVNLLPVYLLEAPLEPQTAPPYRMIPELELDEGPHLGYAMQWFFFALVVLVGFPVFALRQAREKNAAALLSSHQKE